MDKKNERKSREKETERNNCAVLSILTLFYLRGFGIAVLDVMVPLFQMGKGYAAIRGGGCL